MNNNNPFMDMFSNMCSANNMGNMMNNFTSMMNNQSKVQNMFDTDSINRAQKKMMNNMQKASNTMISNAQAMANHATGMMQDNMSTMGNVMKECTSGNYDAHKSQKVLQNIVGQFKENAEYMSRSCLEMLDLAGDMICDSMSMDVCSGSSSSKKKNA